MSRVLSSPEGQMQAGVMAVLGLAYAEQFLRTFAVEGNDLQTIVDTHGVLIARNPPIPGTLGGRAPPPPELPALETLKATTAFVGASLLDGRVRIFAASPLKRFEGACVLAERLRQAVASSDAIRAEDGEAVRHAISVGVATLGRREMMFKQMAHEADGALYQAKAQGRNRVVRAAA